MRCASSSPRSTSRLPKAGALRPEGFNHILARVKGRDAEQLVNEVVLRSQAQAEYAAENYGHFGLNLRRYAHFTSPIRRYADLVVHRALIRALQARRRRPARRRETRALGEIAAQHLRHRAPRHGGRARDHRPADRAFPRRPHRRRRSTAASPASPAPACSSSSTTPAPTASSRRAPSATNISATTKRAHALVGDAERGDATGWAIRVTVRLVEAAPVAGALRFEMLSEGQPGRHVAHSGQEPPNGIAAEDVGRERPVQRRRGAWRQAPISGRGTSETRAASMSWQDVAHQPANCICHP